MKKCFTYFAAALAAFAVLFSCNIEDDIQDNDPIDSVEQEPSVIEQGDGVFSLTLASPQTKTVFGDKVGSTYPKYWSEGDKICVNGTESLALEAGDGAGTSTATFRFSTSIAAAEYNVVYPSSAYDGGTGKVTIKAAQSAAAGAFDPASDIILGHGDNPANITLTNAVAYLKIRLTQGDYGNFGVKTIKVESADKMLNGAFAVAGGTALTVPDASSDASQEAVTLTVTGTPTLTGEAKEFLIAVAPQTLASGFTVTITDTKDNEMVKAKATSAELAAGNILAMPAFKFQEYHPVATPTDLLDFAAACSAADNNYWLVTANIDMDGQSWPSAGTGDASGTAFKGVFDGGNNGTENGGYKISNLSSTTGAFINHAYTSSIIKNVTLDATCSIGYAEDITANCHIGGIVGMTRGTVQNCYNRASVNCTSTSYTKPIYMGGIVGRLYRFGSIDHCYNYAAISCSATGGTQIICMGGVVGSVERNSSGDNATISNSESTGAVDRGTIPADDDSKSSQSYLGGVIGRLLLKAGADKLTISNIAHSTGIINIDYPTAQVANKQVLLGGLIGGIHGASISDPSAEVDIKNSHVQACTVNNGFWNNSIADATCQAAGGLIGYCGGASDGTQNISIIEGCYVNNVAVTARRAFFGGMVGWMRGTLIENCDVLGSSAKSSAQGYIAGGIVASMDNSVIRGCDAKLTKYSNSSLYTKGNYFYTGGIAGWVKGTSTIENCRAYVTNLYQATETANVRGWIAGYCSGTSTTINNCGLGGTYGNTTPTITLNDSNFGDYIYGSNSINVTVGNGANACYYWDGTI